MIFLLAAELLRGVKLSRAAWGILLVVFCFSMVANGVQLRDAGASLRLEGSIWNARMGALEATRDRVSPNYSLDKKQPGQPLAMRFHLLGRELLQRRRRARIVRHPLSQVASEGAAPAAVADQAFIGALGIEAKPVKAAPPALGDPVGPIRSATNARAVTTGSCLRIEPGIGKAGEAEMQIPVGGFSISASRYADWTANLGRYSTEFPVELGSLMGSAVVSIPSDRSTVPWLLKITTARPLTVCPLGTGT